MKYRDNEKKRMTSNTDKMVKLLKKYFETRDDVSMAFLFGSMAKGREHEESDADIGVYIKCGGVSGEIEAETRYECEDEIWADVEKIVGINVDLVVLNRAFPFIADSALKGIPIIIKDRNVYLRFLVRIISEAIDYRAFVYSFWRAKQRRTHAS